MISVILAVILAYLIGSISFAVIFTKIFLHKDVRDLGSGNAGTTNVLRVGGAIPGILTFVFDVLKGFLASYLGKAIFESISTENAEYFGVIGAFACGFACMIGHVFPIFFKFKGGKGVATSVGIFAVCCPIAIVLGLAVFAIGVLVTKIVSLSSLLATVTVVSLCFVFANPNSSIIYQGIFAVLMGALVFFKHSDNIKRLLNGTEKKLKIRR